VARFFLAQEMLLDDRLQMSERTGAVLLPKFIHLRGRGEIRQAFDQPDKFVICCF